MSTVDKLSVLSYNGNMRTKRISKAQLIGATKDLASEYLGFSTNINGQNWSVERLEKRLNAFTRMVELSRRAKAVYDKYTAEQRLSFALSGNYPQDAMEAQQCAQEANQIWLAGF